MSLSQKKDDIAAQRGSPPYGKGIWWYKERRYATVWGTNGGSVTDELTVRLWKSHITSLGLFFIYKYNTKTSWVTPTHQAIEKTATLRKTGKAEACCHINLTPWHSNNSREPQLPASHEEWRVWTTHLGLQILRPPPKGGAPKTPSSKSQRACLWVPLHYSREILNWCTSTHHSYSFRAQHRGGRQNNAHLPVFPWKGLDCILYKLLPEGSAFN